MRHVGGVCSTAPELLAFARNLHEGRPFGHAFTGLLTGHGS
ncbi:hypothetical protein [Nonomuraea sp. SYSU D8015]|nr:hypothetical protein [Nonomuraea sp. SYSU D8015]